MSKSNNLEELLGQWLKPISEMTDDEYFKYKLHRALALPGSTGFERIEFPKLKTIVLGSLFDGDERTKQLEQPEDFYLPFREQCDRQLDEMCRQHDDYFWPHKSGCPLCGSDAYVGFSTVECCMSTCKNFVSKPGM